MKRKVWINKHSFWECRIKRLNGDWVVIQKQKTTPFYEKPVDEIIGRFKSKSDAAIFADLINVKYAPDIYKWFEKKDSTVEDICKSYSASNKYKDVYWLGFFGYSVDDLVFHKNYSARISIGHRKIHQGISVDLEELETLIDNGGHIKVILVKGK